MSEIIQSVGIDMGTTTLQVVFSVLTLEDRGGGFIAPHVEVASMTLDEKKEAFGEPSFRQYECGERGFGQR